MLGPDAIDDEFCATPVLLQARALVIRAQAMRVRLIRQHLDNPAIGDPSAPAFRDHAGQLRLQSLQSGDAAADFAQVPAGDRIHFGARLAWIDRHIQELPDILQRKPQLTAVPDEGQPVEMSTRIGALVALRPGSKRQQARLLIVTNCLHLRAGRPGQVANREHGGFGHENTLEPVATTGFIKSGR